MVNVGKYTIHGSYGNWTPTHPQPTYQDCLWILRQDLGTIDQSWGDLYGKFWFFRSWPFWVFDLWPEIRGENVTSILGYQSGSRMEEAGGLDFVGMFWGPICCLKELFCFWGCIFSVPWKFHGLEDGISYWTGPFAGDMLMFAGV